MKTLCEDEPVVKPSGFRKRLNATSDHGKLSRQVGVADLPRAEEARNTVIKNYKCSKCCCKSHCGLTGHSRTDVAFAASSFGDPNYVPVFPGVMDASWQAFDDYMEAMVEFVMMYQPMQPELTSLLCSTTVDFDDMK